jgi:hypothetical protein
MISRAERVNALSIQGKKKRKGEEGKPLNTPGNEN